MLAVMHIIIYLPLMEIYVENIDVENGFCEFLERCFAH